jgi:hypothetical protein
LGKVDFNTNVDFTDGNWRLIAGKAGTFYQYMGAGGSAEDNRNLATQDYNNFEFWKELSENNVIPSSISTAILKDNKLDPGKAKSFYGVVARNDIDSDVVAYLDNTVLTTPNDVNSGPANVVVTALESVSLRAIDSSVISSTSNRLDCAKTGESYAKELNQELKTMYNNTFSHRFSSFFDS